jgi:predicted solute-binding protein
LSQIRIGVPQYISVRPLIYGLMRSSHDGVEIVYDEPGVLSDALDRGALDVALVPAIEYLRGVGAEVLDGPALVAKTAGRGILLVAQKPVSEIRTIAVHEYCRTPIAVARIVLDKLHHITPDLLVDKNFNGNWRERYDAILASGDAALDLAGRPAADGCEVHSVAEMWDRVVPHPLVLGLWVYKNRELTATYSKWLVTSRNLGLQNLSRLADGIAATSHYNSELLYDYFSQSWSYQLDGEGWAGLRSLEELALEYDLLRRGRLERVFTG